MALSHTSSLTTFGRRGIRLFANSQRDAASCSSKTIHTGIDNLAPRYSKILSECEPYVITHKNNLSELDLAPFGYQIKEEHLYDPTRLNSRHLINSLHHLDAACFGSQEMVTPRWVMFDCGGFPGIVFGFGRKAVKLDDRVRHAYKLMDDKDDDIFVPFSMWVAIRCAEEGAWFGHHFSSANFIAEKPMPGVGTITKVFGMKLAKISKQYGATQWDNKSLGIHLALGPMNLLSAFTPAHTHPETLTYRIDIEEERIVAPLQAGWKPVQEGGGFYIDCIDHEGIRKLHDDIEKGSRYRIIRIERLEHGRQRLWLEVLVQ